MNSQIKQFESSVARDYVIHTQSSPNGMTLLCNDLAGNLVGSRIFTARQLKNTALVSLVLTDLRTTLSRSTNQTVFPSS